MKRKNTLKEAISELRRLTEEPSFLVEQFVMPSRGGYAPQEGAAEEMPQDMPPMEDEMGEDETVEQGVLAVKDEINQIRQIALKTIERLAENPTSEAYQTMKKIFLMCDKAVESSLEPNEQGNKKNI